jgi:peptidoglycan lytic transglycosylase
VHLFARQTVLWRLTPLGLAILLLSSCGGKKQAQVQVPPPPPITAETPTPGATTSPTQSLPQSPKSPEEESGEPALSVPPGTQPILIETGLASWYGTPYNRRRGSNGEIYDMNAMTAAHRTLPLGSIVRVTNIKTGHSALVRITDRGPFVRGRMLDLSLAAAKKVDVWRPGVAMVRMEVLQTPVPLSASGRWAVQIGAFDDENSADRLASRLEHRYHTARVLRFSSPVGDWWVRVRVLGDDRQRAEEVARDTQTPEGAIFLVRLD